MTLRTLSIRQPWAWAIAHGPKRIENRTWTRPYRGQIALHASKGWDYAGEVSPLIRQAWKAQVGSSDFPHPNHPPVSLGAVIAVAELLDICSDLVGPRGIDAACGCGPWAAAGQYHWRLDNVQPLLEPIPARGALGLWRLPEDVDAQVRTAFPEVTR